MTERDYTPTKFSKVLSTITNLQGPSSTKPKIDYTQRSANIQISILRDYQSLKTQVKQLQLQNRQLQSQAQNLRYEKSVQEGKYTLKVNFEEETLSQFQKEKNNQLELLRLKNQEDLSRIKRQFEIKLDEPQRQLKGKDYQTRQLNQKNAYLDLKANQLRKGVQNLEGELLKYRDNNVNLNNLMSNQEFNRKKLEMLTDQLQRQKCEMENQIHVLLDIQAEKSRNINSLEVQLKNSSSTERNLHEKLALLTDNFSTLQEHIAFMKERLLASNQRNDSLERDLKSAEIKLADCQNHINQLKQYQIRFRNELQRYQRRENRSDKEFNELVQQNQRLYNDLNINAQRLHQICIAQGIDA